MTTTITTPCHEHASADFTFTLTELAQILTAHLRQSGRLDSYLEAGATHVRARVRFDWQEDEETGERRDVRFRADVGVVRP